MAKRKCQASAEILKRAKEKGLTPIMLQELVEEILLNETGRIAPYKTHPVFPDALYEVALDSMINDDGKTDEQNMNSLGFIKVFK